MISKVCTLSTLALLVLFAPAAQAGRHDAKGSRIAPAAVGADVAGVAYYYNGVPDGTITAVRVTGPRSYTLTNLNNAFAIGYPGVNIPQHAAQMAPVDVHAFREMRFEYTCSPNPAVSIRSTPLVTLFARTPLDGFWHTSPAMGNGTSEGPGQFLTYQFVSFQPPGWLPGIPAARTVDQADIIFFGGNDKTANSIRIGEIVIVAQNGTGNTPDFTPSSYATDTDTAFNHQFPIPPP